METFPSRMALPHTMALPVIFLGDIDPPMDVSNKPPINLDIPFKNGIS
jgi:hypothetical protein